MKIALAQINPTIGAFSANLAKMIRMAEEARDRGCQLVVFPELAICGYPPRDLLERPEFVAANLEATEALVKATKGITLICGFVDLVREKGGKPLRNATLVAQDGKVLARAYKRLLPTYDVFDETRYFEPGKTATVTEIGGIPFGLSICEDIWNDADFFPSPLYDLDPVAELVATGAKIVVNISASPFYLGKGHLRERLLCHLSAKYQRPFLYCNQVGADDHLIFDGHSLVADKGKVLARAASFKEDLLIFDLAAEKGPMAPYFERDDEEALEALTLGIRDYFSKTGFSLAVVGLSGGIDSSVTAALAVRALGAEGVLGVLMPSPYTSRASMEDAQALATALGIQTKTIAITRIYQEYRVCLEGALGEPPGDITDQNIQARIRGNLLMALANQYRGLVLCTGNKAEFAVGYCTLYGDMCGALSVLADVPKLMVYKLGRLINAQHGKKIIPERVFIKAPSAELKPNQKDEDDLPAYILLDTLVKGYVEELKSPEDLLASGLPPESLEQTLKMIYRAEYKRWQAAPGLKITAKAFGYGRRYPIAHGFDPLKFRNRRVL
ncbi:NAD+ synthase [Thermosulfuriphilus ammonigenes]|uniref:Glutamine-dependent NAD(+) synthetase n=1 Tax=Thermosulfuriphilus ammonigenes TaxID=1936021 RepID=A0A6G7PXR6_9BACT|nr:NAD+ synthase [Thermosulfuriphilus ammonigenes]MBA2849413.1 NAD+ synthetase [Thermosulfuriphilus ammonigenes]QIJ72484.1 NAD+ synthase [Thermosulfuriphilus ammonigenes]